MLLLRINHLSKALVIRRLPVDLLAPLCHISSYLTFSSNNNNDSNNSNKTDSSKQQSYKPADPVTALDIDPDTLSRAIYTIYAVLTLCPIVPTFIHTLVDLGIPKACYILHLACITDQLTSPPTSAPAPAKVALIDDHVAAVSDESMMEVLAQLETVCFLFMKHIPIELSVTYLYEYLTDTRTHAALSRTLEVSRTENGLLVTLRRSDLVTPVYPASTGMESLLLPCQQTSSRITPFLSLALTSPSSLVAAKHGPTNSDSRAVLVEKGTREGDAYVDIVEMLGGLSLGREGALTGSDPATQLRDAYSKTRLVSILLQSFEAYIRTISSNQVPTIPSPSATPTPDASQSSESLGIASKLFVSCLYTYFKVPSAGSTSSTHLESESEGVDAIDMVQVCGIAMVVLQQEIPLSSLLYDGSGCITVFLLLYCTISNIIYVCIQARAFCDWYMLCCR